MFIYIFPSFLYSRRFVPVPLKFLCGGGGGAFFFIFESDRANFESKSKDGQSS